ncbi:MAG: hypothetical protein KC550_03050 [Nanoarchaeota archaeon]|nr:hypothetical protein [Nanoarchaeota archaeon]
MKLQENKKAIELSLQTIVIFIIIVIVLIVIVYFFVGNYSEGSHRIIDTGGEIINNTLLE